MTRPVKVRRLTDQEGQKLQRIVRRGTAGTARYRRAIEPGPQRVQALGSLTTGVPENLRKSPDGRVGSGLGCS
ncbi:hypothetical protein GCM10017559_59520 [Streptosporangium longisporum]|uniref:Transposase n=1 Tax=Streptosporangium longisporum TaxID=46187 RepID=A0ABN3YCW6_9ACTN